jgi:hypothetical protein
VKRHIFFLLLTLAACTGGSLMTMNSFSDISIGTSSADVVAIYGEPYAVHKKGDGTIEYEYLERIKAGGRNLEERRYILIIKNGKVVSKEIKQSSPSPYYFDSYDMQTTQNGSPAPGSDK